MTTKKTHLSQGGQFNSVQLNLVTFVDVYKALAQGNLDDCVYMMDNSFGSEGRGTANLKTVCKQSQVLNWIIYAMDSEKRIDGQWPAMAKINNIVFLDQDGNDVADHKVCTGFKIYGAPDEIRSKETPVYYYWAGTVLPTLPPGVYKYRLIIELQKPDASGSVYMNLDTPSLEVISV